MPVAHFTGRHKTQNQLKKNLQRQKKKPYPAQFLIFLGYFEIEMHWIFMWSTSVNELFFSDEKSHTQKMHNN